jgi:acyl transferase domain-containing protein/NAD(P)-dependent dehydrogenase (short-subunit alcohol dehydrogenase family)/acyl carrier protein
MMEPILDGFREVAASISYASPKIPVVGNVKGEVMSSAPDADYWTRHIRETVRFDNGLRALSSYHVFLEIGPKPVLSRFGAQASSDPNAQWLSTLRPDLPDWEAVEHAAARLYVCGAGPDFERFFPASQGRRISGLPTYAFDRRRFALPAVKRDVAEKRVATDVRDWGYRPEWVPERADRMIAKHAVYVLEDQTGVAAELAKALSAEGGECRTVSVQDLGAGRRPVDAELVCLWALDWKRPADVVLDLSERLLSLLQIVCGSSDLRGTLWLVTRDAAPAPAHSNRYPTDGFVQNALWGFARSIAAEFPNVGIRLVDVSGTASECARAIGEELSTDARSTAVCRRGTERFVLRLEKQALEPSQENATFRGAWLVTGGLGRRGMEVCGWLIDRGARHVVLIGRRPPSVAEQHAIERWRSAGVAVETKAADVTDLHVLRGVLASVPSEWPAFEGVVHAAGIRDDGVLHRQTGERFRAVLSPKVIGGWNLHVATAELPLRYFLLYSSAASVLGNAAQSSYAAANGFLDGLAWHRRELGLPATSVNWSVWEDTAQDARIARQFERHGIIPMSTTGALTALERAIALNSPQIAIIPADKTLSADPADAAKRDTSLRRRPQGLKAAPGSRTRPELEELIIQTLASILGRAAADLDRTRGFFEQGVDSLNVVELRNRLETELEQSFPISLAFDYPTVEALARKLAELQAVESGAPAPKSSRRAASEPIAVVSMACRFPGGANTVEAFWDLLRDGVDAITEVPANRWDAWSRYHPDAAHPGSITTRHGGFIDDVDRFDATFFGISGREALHLDPQHRLLLEVSWQLLERAGIAPSTLAGSQTGVFVGISTNDYLQRLNRRAEDIDAYVASGNALCVAANRLSYFFGFEGPSLAIDTACSSSLVAIHEACQSLRDGESDLAIAGGVNLLLDPTISINHSRARMLARDGRSKAFSADADGMSRAEGCGLVLLKRLSDVATEERVLAVIRGSAVNQDGRTSGLTVPNGHAQQRVVRKALERAGLTSADIDYVETHGTGTPLGDPIEAGALSAVFRDAGKVVAIGSVKTNIGHLESAAGVAGLIKTVLALKEKTIPAHLHCAVPNPHVDWANSPLRIPRGREPWPASSGPMRAGVSSFGFGGTNAHVIVEEAPARPNAAAIDWSTYLLVISAKTAPALSGLAEAYSQFLATTTHSPADICCTAACGRDHFPHRLAVLGKGTSELREGIRSWLQDRPAASVWHGIAGSPVTDPPLAIAHVDAAEPETWAQVAAAYTRGSVDIAAVYAGLSRDASFARVILPGHPFERQRYFVEAPGAETTAHDLYRMEWQERELRTHVRRMSGYWLVLADEDGWGEAIARTLERRGVRTVVKPYRRGVQPDRLVNGAGMPDAILHAWAVDAPPADLLQGSELLATQQQILGSVISLVREIDAMPSHPQLCVLTKGAQRVARGDRVEGLAQSTLWGLCRTIPLDTRIACSVVDVPWTEPNSKDIDAVCSLLAESSSETQFAVRSGKPYFPRLRPWTPDRNRRIEIRSDASYLITGAFGSVGQQIGRWLADAGARSLWLIGRRGAYSDAATRYLQELNARGVSTRVGSVNVANQHEVPAQLRHWSASSPPLRGVVHAAGVNGETVLPKLKWPQVADVVEGKLVGAWVLHQATSAGPLDFFVECSSIASLWGGQRQAAYAAANAFLDALAAHRDAQGKPALSVNWGPLSGSSMLSPTAAATLASLGIESMPLSGAVSRLRVMLDDGAQQAACVRADWRRFAALYQTRSGAGIFEDVVRASAKNAPEPTTEGGYTKTSEVSDGELRDWMAGQLSAALGVSVHRLDMRTPLPRLGLDSLMAAELKNRVRAQFGLDVPVSDFLGDLSVNEWASKVSQSRAPQPAGEQPGERWVAGEI